MNARHVPPRAGALALPGVLAVASLCLLLAACGDDREPDPRICSGGPCDVAADCREACESTCQSPDFGSFDCVEEACECECFFGCP